MLLCKNTSDNNGVISFVFFKLNWANTDVAGIGSLGGGSDLETRDWGLSSESHEWLLNNMTKSPDLLMFMVLWF